jgi:hypothetical protein
MLLEVVNTDMMWINIVVVFVRASRFDMTIFGWLLATPSDIPVATSTLCYQGLSAVTWKISPSQCLVCAFRRDKAISFRCASSFWVLALVVVSTPWTLPFRKSHMETAPTYYYHLRERQGTDLVKNLCNSNKEQKTLLSRIHQYIWVKWF